MNGPNLSWPTRSFSYIPFQWVSKCLKHWSLDFLDQKWYHKLCLTILHTWEVSDPVLQRPKSKPCHRLSDISSLFPAVNYCNLGNLEQQKQSRAHHVSLQIWTLASPTTFNISGCVAKSTEILAQLLLPKLPVLIWLSSEIVSFSSGVLRNWPHACNVLTTLET